MRADPAPAEARPDHSAPAAWAVHRAASDLRRGVPVALDGADPLLVVSAETAGPEALTGFRYGSTGRPVVVLTGERAEAVLGHPADAPRGAVALRIPGRLPAVETLRALADPTRQQVVSEAPDIAPLPGLAAASLALAKLGRLLPAVMAASLRAGGAADFLTVAAEDVLAVAARPAASLARVAEAQVPLELAAETRVIAYRSPDSGAEHLAILVGRPEGRDAPLVRVHSECFTGDVLGSLRCDCGPQLQGALRRMAEEGAGVVLYLAQEGRGIGLVNKLRAYALQDRGLDTLDANRALGWGADERDFAAAAVMLEDLGLRRVRLLTNNPAKVSALTACGVEVVGRERHAFAPNGVNDFYLATKALRFGHLLG